MTVPPWPINVCTHALAASRPHGSHTFIDRSAEPVSTKPDAQPVAYATHVTAPDADTTARYTTKYMRIQPARHPKNTLSYLCDQQAEPSPFHSWPFGQTWVSTITSPRPTNHQISLAWPQHIGGTTKTPVGCRPCRRKKPGYRHGLQRPRGSTRKHDVTQKPYLGLGSRTAQLSHASQISSRERRQEVK